MWPHSTRRARNPTPSPSLTWTRVQRATPRSSARSRCRASATSSTTFEDGLVADILLGCKYGHRLHFWDFTKRKHVQEIDLGGEHQLIFELRPAHDPTRAYGFVNCVVSLKDLSSSIWLWHRDGATWAASKIITIPAEPAVAEDLPPLLKGFKAAPPLVTDINLSMDDRFLYVACWGTGDMHQYDVSDPFKPKLTGKVLLARRPIRARWSHGPSTEVSDLVR